jgi:hypothetical protein
VTGHHRGRFGVVPERAGRGGGHRLDLDPVREARGRQALLDPGPLGGVHVGREDRPEPVLGDVGEDVEGKGLPLGDHGGQELLDDQEVAPAVGDDVDPDAVGVGHVGRGDDATRLLGSRLGAVDHQLADGVVDPRPGVGRRRLLREDPVEDLEVLVQCLSGGELGGLVGGHRDLGVLGISGLRLHP